MTLDEVKMATFWFYDGRINLYDFPSQHVGEKAIPVRIVPEEEWKKIKADSDCNAKKPEPAKLDAR